MNYYLQTFCYNHRLKELSELTGQKWNNSACERQAMMLDLSWGLGGFKFTQGYDCDQIFLILFCPYERGIYIINLNSLFREHRGHR